MTYAQMMYWFIETGDSFRSDSETMYAVFLSMYVDPLFVASVDSRTHDVVTPR